MPFTRVTPTHDLVWAATGQPLSSFAKTVTAAEGMIGTIEVPVTDQDGFVTSSGNPFTGWAYSVDIQYRKGSSIKTGRKSFQPLSGQTEVDLDVLPDGGITTPVAGTIPAVLSVNGETGHVTVSGEGGGGGGGEGVALPGIDLNEAGERFRILADDPEIDLRSGGGDRIRIEADYLQLSNDALTIDLDDQVLSVQRTDGNRVELRHDRPFRLTDIDPETGNTAPELLESELLWPVERGTIATREWASSNIVREVDGSYPLPPAGHTAYIYVGTSDPALQLTPALPLPEGSEWRQPV